MKEERKKEREGVVVGGMLSELTIILNSAVDDEYFSQFIHSQALPKNPSRIIQVRHTIFRMTFREKTYKN